MMQYSDDGALYIAAPEQHERLCEWLLDVSARLIAVDVESEVRPDSGPLMASAERLDSDEDCSRRFKYLVGKVCKSRIWSSDNHRLFLQLKQVAQQQMSRVASLCEAHCAVLLDGPEGARLRHLHWSHTELEQRVGGQGPLSPSSPDSQGPPQPPQPPQPSRAARSLLLRSCFHPKFRIGRCRLRSGAPQGRRARGGRNRAQKRA